MSVPHRCRCHQVFFMIQGTNKPTMRTPISEPPFTPVSRLYLACAQAARIESERFPSPIFEWREELGDMMHEVRGAYDRGDTEAERIHVSAAVHLYRRILNKIGELDLEEPQTLIVTFNGLVRRHNELNPQGPER